MTSRPWTRGLRAGQVLPGEEQVLKLGSTGSKVSTKSVSPKPSMQLRKKSVSPQNGAAPASNGATPVQGEMSLVQMLQEIEVRVPHIRDHTELNRIWDLNRAIQKKVEDREVELRGRSVHYCY